MNPVQSSLRMHEGNPIVRNRITKNWTEHIHDVPLRNARAHRTNSVVTGGQMWE